MRKPLVSGESSKTGYNTIDQNARERLLSGLDDIEMGNARLRDSEARLVESESIGQSVLEDLARQKEAIKRTGGKFDEMDEDHSTVNTVLMTMGFNALTNKYLCYLLVFLIICVMGLVFIISLTS
mmetsp:Transcript_31046/g.43018  ORF Transcript_31046/g.43018 Transcript_31046/m.43018 type:complete len:125 (-) Transcript_31046:302-676(-)|eukprot:CAMPEP_0196588870 /NCGR_PEP_ID=MMETSP1081-20130531/61968_1 /TAXON_ID=36882 /ORGANISM="Pyramimonas amylifera, Strain CCMP720" /LENGTH=124 /DNA_ID=CAMNT_0041911501 /DNA_START=106 /DNA_END=480 /DNA_ORIENTATION=+